MAEENTSKIKETENCSDTNPQEMMSEEGSVRTVIVKDVVDVEDVVSVALKGQEECVSVTKEAPKPPSVSLRRHSTGAIGTRGGKLEVQSRYLGNHHVPSTHDLCKHGKLPDRDDPVKPWKVVRRRSVEGSEVVKAETSGLRRMSLGSPSRQIRNTKPQSPVAAKRDALAVKKRPCGSSVTSETSSYKGDNEMVRSVDGLSVRSKGTESTLSSGSVIVKKVPGLRNEKSDSAMKKVSRTSDAESSKVYTPRIKDKAKAQAISNEDVKEKAKVQTISNEDVKEKTVCVVEASVKDVKRSSEKKTMRSRLISLATPKQVPGKVSTRKKKESGDAKTKKIGVKITLAKQLSFKKGKSLAPKLEDASPKQIKFKNLKGVVESRTDSCESSKREKVVLRRRKVEGKKKMMTLLNSVIEETANKLMKVRKTKVKALIGAFETVISLQDTKTPQGKEETSESKVNPLGENK
ncbi:unnamed protein product [Eruca vesicaria subsp. sativa]|uniref:Calmodulin-binding domain-containing protein n=1 Tax=Eruca vesicaria subsp. sativa TaxID=29727 RepID=A0ABC8M0C1_ERUVS|nr:unnamed protein product [Eruca vesicaria subsp. sativa]